MTSPARPPQEGSQSGRRDARQNRDRLIGEARALIAVDGVDASLEEISRRSDVGVATLYRNFPTRDDLVRTLYDLALAELATVQEEVGAAATAWDGVVVYAERVAEWLVADPSLPPIIKRMAALDPGYRPAADFEKIIAALVAQAKQDGDLRADVEAVDVGLLVTMVGSLGRLGDGYAGQWRRQLSIVLDGLRAPGGARPKLPGRPLNAGEYQASLHGLTRRARRHASRRSAPAAGSGD
jgi:AcrR family transcriptional regulator